MTGLPRRRTTLRSGVVLTTALGAAVALAGCGLFGSRNDDGTTSVSVFDVKPGQCFTAPQKVQAELSDLSRIDCTAPHTQEAYAVTTYANVDGSDPAVYPGNDLLGKFAQGRCAQAFGTYVGVDYLDSKLFFTYLVPSARGWEQDKDRAVLCFVTTTGAQLTATVKGTKQ